ncbi:hypothetical protein GCM10007908_21460 [Rhizobium albus]|nr:hypothetical protein GCM10007908_21460 [Rhizobium albus]
MVSRPMVSPALFARTLVTCTQASRLLVLGMLAPLVTATVRKTFGVAQCSARFAGGGAMGVVVGQRICDRMSARRAMSSVALRPLSRNRRGVAAAACSDMRRLRRCGVSAPAAPSAPPLSILGASGVAEWVGSHRMRARFAVQARGLAGR